MQVLCCQPGYGYGGCHDVLPRPSRNPSARLAVAGRVAWIQGGGSVWAQRVRMQAMIQNIRYRGTGICRAGLEDDAPFALAIAASVLSTLVLPADTSSEDTNESVSPLGGDDVRYAAMGIISFIPLFNWLVWVFAWLDTRKQRYLIYAIVYLAPYLRSGLSLSPEDSWLPIASVLACILHVQLDISASSEGGEDLNISKTLFTASQVKQMKERADTLLLRLKQLAERSAPKPTTEELTTAEDISLAEMEQWDEKFAKSKAAELEENSETVRDIDS
ncbi:hypothetical protein KC19_2G162400 [Ceratodon purpureus]|uniref:Uncharacterized protein n=1 Tax=Ceratodon purpureus TaxID=3225 RepID=A0A8T0IYD3_CERPU|nr:hypothetical protein KC19_2G162400 [Ceratodon purpureus]